MISSNCLQSSLVNGILGYPDNDQYAAAIHEAGGHTTEPRGYRHPDLRNMILWDMPGAGTLTNNDKTYFEDNYLYAFDSLIIVTAERYKKRKRKMEKRECNVTRLQVIDLEIATKAQEYHIPVLFVRNRCDQVSPLPFLSVCMTIDFYGILVSSIQDEKIRN